MSLLATLGGEPGPRQRVRVAVGSQQNLQFAMPPYVSGGVPLYADFVVTWNRLFAIAFAAVTLVLTLLVLKRTPLGLDIRAVTQNRDNGACLGIRTRRVDRLAFGFGSGLAGLAGVALCPIYSVNPGMGATFIVDSFMVVVLGGVGTVAATRRGPALGSAAPTSSSSPSTGPWPPRSSCSPASSCSAAPPRGPVRRAAPAMSGAVDLASAVRRSDASARRWGATRCWRASSASSWRRPWPRAAPAGPLPRQHGRTTGGLRDPRRRPRPRLGLSRHPQPRHGLFFAIGGTSARCTCWPMPTRSPAPHRT